MRSVYDEVLAVKGVDPIAQDDSEALSDAIDTLGLTSGLVEVQTGAATGTPDSYSVACKVTECATADGTYADVTGATASLTDDSKHAQIRLEGLGTSRLRYLKISMTPDFTGGTTPKALIAATAYLGRDQQVPVANSATQS